jgi:biopolymer transport protein ExbD
MPRFRGAGRDEGGEVGIDISPLMDCVFILLIFFIVTTTFVEERGMEVDTPQAASGGNNDEKTSITLEITPAGDIQYEGRAVALKGVRNLVERELSQYPDLPVIVSIKSGSGVRTQVMASVTDRARQGGAKIVRLGRR